MRTWRGCLTVLSALLFPALILAGLASPANANTCTDSSNCYADAFVAVNSPSGFNGVYGNLRSNCDYIWVDTSEFIKRNLIAWGHGSRR